MKKFLFGILIVFILIGAVGVAFDADAAVRVNGYYRKDGTYVRPHYRSNPDGNPYNNWSFPGNTNPYTGKTATGNPSTYLKNYSSSYSSAPYRPTISPYKPTIVNKLKLLPDNTLIRKTNSTKVYNVLGGKKYWIPTATKFRSFGYKWSDVQIVSSDFTDDNHDGKMTYKSGILVKSWYHPYVWFLTPDGGRKWITNAFSLTACGYKWSDISTIPESEIQLLRWDGNNSAGTITYPSCS